MALTEQEKAILEYAKANGKSEIEAKAAIAKYRTEQTTTPTTPAPAEKPNVFSSQGAIGKAARKVTDFLGGEAVADTYGAEIAKATATEDAKKLIDQPSVRDTAGSALKFGSTFLGGAGAGANVAKLAAYGAGAGYAYDIGQNLEEGDKVAEAVLPGGATVIGGITGPIGGKGVNKTGKVVKESVQEGAEAVKNAARAVSESGPVKGGYQAAKELAERVPRFIGRKQVELRDAATRAERIASAPEPVAKAISAGVPEPIINTVEQADPATRKGYAEIVRIAEDSVSTTGTLKQKLRPEIVAGDAAADQYKLIDTQRKKVGQAIGETTKALSKDVTVPMKESYDILDDQMRELGVDIVYGENGATLNFGKTGFTKAQRTKINELYELATEGGDNLSPFQIHDKDRLFSQLQREARMEGIGDIIVDTPNGQMSLFNVFRDVYADNLERLSPEIKKLNRQYRNLRTFVDDIEGSIIKSGKFETNKNVDPAEFAQTNLRRLFSEAQSAADYRAIAEEMDQASRALGYQGGKPEDLARFAYELRKIYPDTTPPTGFTGSIRTGIGGLVDGVLNAGKADTTDQQKALRELISYFEDAVD